MRYRVPSSYVRAFAWLAELPDDQAASVTEAFASARNGSRARILKSVVERASVPAAELEAVFDALLELIRTMQESGETESVETVSAQLARDPALVVGAPERESLERRLANLLKSQALTRLAKAVDLQADHGNVFRLARIFSELRPLFELDVTQAPESVTLTHKLKIEFYNSSLDVDNFYVALDHEDLLSLQGVIDREVRKLSTIDESLKRAGISRINFAEENE